jgi:parallel beta-helix repeat protein
MLLLQRRSALVALATIAGSLVSTTTAGFSSQSSSVVSSATTTSTSAAADTEEEAAALTPAAEESWTRHRVLNKKTNKTSSKKIKSENNKTKKKKGKEGSSRKIVVFPGESIQDAINNASEGSTIVVKAGTYMEEFNQRYGLHITTNGIKLHAEEDGSNGPGVVQIVPYGEQEIGIFVAPKGCTYLDINDVCNDVLNGFELKGISVKGFPRNGIQTRWVNDFSIMNSHSMINLENGIYPTLSSNGIISNCTSSGSLDSGLWVAGSIGVQVIGNEIFDCSTGYEVTVSRDVYATENFIHDNVAGVGFYHANMAGTNPDYSSYDNWVVENNIIVNNNRVNTAPEGSFAASIPSGCGVLIVGVRGHTFRRNVIKDNNFQGILMAGYCSVLEAIFGIDCSIDPPKDGDPSVNFNTIVDNIMSGNGGNTNPDISFLPSLDIVYGQSFGEELGEAGEQNCFEGNQSEEGVPIVGISVDLGTFQPFPLPTAGCE